MFLMVVTDSEGLNYSQDVGTIDEFCKHLNHAPESKDTKIYFKWRGKPDDAQTAEIL